MTDLRRWQVNVATPLLTLNAERTQHWRKRARYVKDVRTAFADAALEAGVPHLERARMVAQPLQKRGPLADILGHVPTVKAAIDGIVDAGVLIDDRPEFLLAVVCRPPIYHVTTGLAIAIIDLGPVVRYDAPHLADVPPASTRRSQHA